MNAQLRPFLYLRAIFSRDQMKGETYRREIDLMSSTNRISYRPLYFSYSRAWRHLQVRQVPEERGYLGPPLPCGVYEMIFVTCDAQR